MLTQTLPTLGTSSYPTEPPFSLLHHHPATYDDCPPGTTTTSPASSSLNPSSPCCTPPTTATGDRKPPHLPPELWLQIFPSILSSSSSTTSDTFPKTLTNLHLVCRGFHSLLLQHEASLVRNVMRTQTVNFPFPGAQEDEEGQGPEPDAGKGEWQGAGAGRKEKNPVMRGRRSLSLEEASRVVFPSSPLISSISSFRELWMLQRRLEAFSECEEVWRTCTCWGPEFAWGRDRWESVHFLGLAGLVRLGDVGACPWIEGGEAGGESGTHDYGMHDDDEDEKGIARRRPSPAFRLSSSGRTFGSASLPFPARGGSNIRFLLSSSSSSSSFTSTLESHANRLTHLLSLPPLPLALLLFKLHTALRLLRVLGPKPLRTTPSSSSVSSPHHRPGDSTTTPQEVGMAEVWYDGNGMGVTRCEVEVVAEECLLGFGPEVLVGLVENGAGDGDGDEEGEHGEGEGKWGDEQQKQLQRRRGLRRRGRWGR
ncbi:hypothetical protein KC340_g18147, partial [Hortaea werneckii]